MTELSPNQRPIQQFLVPSGKFIIDSLELVQGTSVLLTPETSPVKVKQNPSDANDLEVMSVLGKNPLSRSQSDTQLNSPKPPAKITKSESKLKSAEEKETSPTSKGGNRAKGRTGRARKPAAKAKVATESGDKKRRASSVPGKRNTPDPNTTLVTDYFPIRRSSRVPSKALKKQHQLDIEEKILSGCEDGIEVVPIEGKGRGVISTKPFSKGDFVVEYIGDTISQATAKRRELKYTDNPEFGCYMYYFNFRNNSYCVDATAESDKLGRLLNHSKANGNCCTKVVGINNKPYLILVAARDISEGEELLYDYGDRSKSSLEAHPWLAL